MKLIIQLVLAVAVILCAAYFIIHDNNKTQAWKKILMILFVLCAVVFIAFPQLANSVAELVGVGRGADLLLYALVIIVFFKIISDSLKRRDDKKRFAKLVRQVALLQAKDNQLNSKTRASKSKKSA